MSYRKDTMAQCVQVSTGTGAWILGVGSQSIWRFALEVVAHMAVAHLVWRGARSRASLT
jgi:hypothetical protein